MPRIFSYRSMKNYPVLATVGTSEADALAPVRRRARTYYMTAILVSLFIAAGGVAGILFLLAQRRASRQIREQASLLDRARDAIAVVDLDGRVTYWNKSAERLYGWTADEAIGRAAGELFERNTDLPEFRKAFAEALSTGEWTGELVPISRSGQRVITEGRWTLLRDHEGRPAGMLTINTDITERKRLEEQFLRAQRLESIGTMAAGIAHDLNNVLTPIMLAIEFLKERATDARSLEMLETMGGSARRGAAMIGQVLTFARGKEGHRVDVHAGELIADVARVVRDTLPKDIEIRTEVAGGLPPIAGDPTQLHQVLLNLCVNARDAMPAGGQLTISAHLATVEEKNEARHLDAKAGAYVVLQVDDSGTGIAREAQDKIFDPFFTTKGLGKGTGLGLSTSLTIVKSHGGRHPRGQRAREGHAVSRLPARFHR